MLISPNRPFLWDSHYEGDKQIFTHVQYIDDVVESAQKIRHLSDNGFTQEREFQHIARISEADAVNHQEEITAALNGDMGPLRRYLQGDGRKYCTCRPEGI